MRRYVVEVDGFDNTIVEAETAGKAKWKVFQRIREAGYITDFREFLDRVYVLHMGSAP